jgi:hypothetical protein
MFLAGALFMLLIVVAAGIREEDRATQVRRDRRLRLRSQAPNYRAAAVRRLAGVGQRVPDADSNQSRQGEADGRPGWLR